MFSRHDPDEIVAVLSALEKEAFQIDGFVSEGGNNLALAARHLSNPRPNPLERAGLSLMRKARVST